MKFSQWVDEYCINILAFSRKTGISKSTLLRILNDKKTSRGTALQISIATEGKVTLEDMGFAPINKT